MDFLCVQFQFTTKQTKLFKPCLNYEVLTCKLSNRELFSNNLEPTWPKVTAIPPYSRPL